MMIFSLLLTFAIMLLAFKFFYDAIVSKSTIQDGIISFNLKFLFLPNEDMSNLIPTINLDLILMIFLLSIINIIALLFAIKLKRPNKFILALNLLTLISLIGIGILSIAFKSDATLSISKVYSAIFLGKSEFLADVTGQEITLIYFLTIAIIANFSLSCFYCSKIRKIAEYLRTEENSVRTSRNNIILNSRSTTRNTQSQIRH